MKYYDDANRGKFQTEYGKQLVSFDGMLFAGRSGRLNVTPTDIDGFLQFDIGNAYIFFELKHSGGVPTGQENALTKLADTITAGGGNCVVIYATHQTEYPEVIMAKDAQVARVYHRGRWFVPNMRKTLYDVANDYNEYFRSEYEQTNKRIY